MNILISDDEVLDRSEWISLYLDKEELESEINDFLHNPERGGSSSRLYWSIAAYDTGDERLDEYLIDEYPGPNPDLDELVNFAYELDNVMLQYSTGAVLAYLELFEDHSFGYWDQYVGA